LHDLGSKVYSHISAAHLFAGANSGTWSWGKVTEEKKGADLAAMKKLQAKKKK
jgi:hypothetical protein